MNWKEKDLEYVWHPFTQMADYEKRDPVVIERGEGAKLYDTAGNEYYDGVSSLWLNVHGHRVEEIDRAIREQLDKIAHTTLLGRGSVPSIQLAELLAEITPTDLNHVFYSDSGATAVEIAMKMAIQYWANQEGRATAKQRFLSFKNGYHGDTFGPMSVVPDPVFHWPFKTILPDPIQIDFPAVTGWNEEEQAQEILKNCLEEFERVLVENMDEIAGVIVEPVQGAGGIVPAPRGFLSGLRAITNKYEQLLIVDEVATGFGRLGTMFACEREMICPDIIALGKGLTGGYLPVAATMATDRIYNQFLGERHEALLHGHSFTGNALGCAAALASINLLKSALPDFGEKIRVIEEGLEPVREIDGVDELRVDGFMCGIELKESGEESPGWDVCEIARDYGMLIRPLGNVVVFMPPPGAEIGELKQMVAILVESIKEFGKRN